MSVRHEVTEGVRSDRKSSFLIRDILPESVDLSPFVRAETGGQQSTPGPPSVTGGLDLLQMRPWDCRLILSPEPVMGTGVRSGGPVVGPSQLGRVLPSCGAVCCVMCSASSGWPTGTQFSDLLAHSCVLPTGNGSPTTGLTAGHLPWACASSIGPMVYEDDSNPNPGDLSSSPPPHLTSGTDGHSVERSLGLTKDRSSPGSSSAVSRKVRRNRTVFTELQLMGLERRFDSQKYLSTPDRAELARALGLTQLQVKTWYQNRRMKWKKQVMQGGCTIPPTKPKGRPKKNSIPSLAECDAASKAAFLAPGVKGPSEFLPFPSTAIASDAIL